MGMGMFSTASDVAVDLGTVNTCIYTRGAVALSEPSVVAFNTAQGGIEAIGTDARDMLGRTPANITAIWPMRNGVIADFDAVEKDARTLRPESAGQHLLADATRDRCAGRQHAGGASGREGKCEADEGNDVRFVDEPMAAAIGAGLPVTEPTGNMIIDIGGGTTDIAVVSLAGVVYGRLCAWRAGTWTMQLSST